MITNEKYILLNESLKAVSNDYLNILTLISSPGTGKTHTTIKYLNDNDINHAYINSYATPLSFYSLLYKYRNKKVVVFDDLHGVSNPLVLSMLKSACWKSDGAKIVSYYSTSSKMDLNELPESFEFKPNIVLIFNNQISGYEPISNRGLTINFDFTFKEKLKIFDEIKEDADLDQDVIDYVKLNCTDATNNLSIRSLVILSKIKKNKQDFKMFAKEMLKQDEDKSLLISLTAKEWCDKTGMHRATYFRQKKKINT